MTDNRLHYETLAGRPTKGLVFAQLIEQLRLAQEAAALLGHLHNTEDNQMDKILAHGWLGISELLKRLTHRVTEMAKGSLQ